MPVLARYLVKAVLGYTALVMLVLAILSGLYLFITQQDDIGIGSYTVADAFMFVAFSIPQYLFDLLPIGALIGALLGLGNLARSSELVVMRTAGISVFRIAGWVAIAGVLLTGITWIIGDYIAPPLEQYARQQKTFAKFSEFSLTNNRSAWAKDGNTFISVQQQSAQNQFGGVYVLRFNEQRRLVSMGHANSARVGADNRWELRNYEESTLVGDSVTVRRLPQTELETRLSPDFLGLAVVDPEALPGKALFAYIRHLHANGLDARDYETAFWARISRTVALLVVVMLAVPFAFGPMRSTGAGARTVVGVLIGAGFSLLAKLLENGGEVFNLEPLVIAWAPTVLLALLTTVIIARVR